MKVVINVPSWVKEYNKYLCGRRRPAPIVLCNRIWCRYKYYLRAVFDSLNKAVVNGYLNYKSPSKHQNNTFRVQTAGGSWSHGYVYFQEECFSDWSHQRMASPVLIHSHLRHILPDRKRCKLSHKRGKDNRSRFQCATTSCSLHVSLHSECNCFTKFHTNYLSIRGVFRGFTGSTPTPI